MLKVKEFSWIGTTVKVNGEEIEGVVRLEVSPDTSAVIETKTGKIYLEGAVSIDITEK